MKILVTGGTGFLGRHAAMRLRRRGDDVLVLGRNDAVGRALEEHGIRYVKADLADADRVAAACAGCEHVIHSGGLASPWGKYETFFRANVLGTRNVLAGCRRHGVRRLVHLSSPSVYFDYRSRLRIKESDPVPAPVTAYAETKLLADRDVEAAAGEGLETVRLRPRAIFGPGDQAVLVRVIRAAEQGRMPVVAGGKSFVDLTYVDNVVDALLLSLEASKAALGGVYNVTNDEPITMRGMAELLFRHLGKDVKLVNLPFAVAHSAAAVLEVFYRSFRHGAEPPLTKYAVGLMARSQTLDITAAREKLGYAPTVTLDEGMRRFAQWWNVGRHRADAASRLGIQ